ncbi:MAG: DUF551 domain-containing protein [Hymenobacter sp.]|nr:MAG: DUF551 domain-containing protein [Hymenobacter sp.]
MESQWIPIGQQQPPTGQPVLVFEDSDREYDAPMQDTMRVAVYQGEGRRFGYADALGGRHPAQNVTHWMHLPSVPAVQ